MSNSSAPIVIIGSGLAGYNLAKELRKLAADQPLLMITGDDGRSYSKPMLSTGYGKNKTADELAMNTAAGMAEQLNMTIRTNTVVTAIDIDAHTISLGDENGLNTASWFWPGVQKRWVHVSKVVLKIWCSRSMISKTTPNSVPQPKVRSAF